MAQAKADIFCIFVHGQELFYLAIDIISDFKHKVNDFGVFGYILYSGKMTSFKGFWI